MMCHSSQQDKLQLFKTMCYGNSDKPRRMDEIWGKCHRLIVFHYWWHGADSGVTSVVMMVKIRWKVLNSYIIFLNCTGRYYSHNTLIPTNKIITICSPVCRWPQCHDFGLPGWWHWWLGVGGHTDWHLLIGPRWISTSSMSVCYSTQ